MFHNGAADQKCILALNHSVLYKEPKIHDLAHKKSVQRSENWSDVIHFLGLGGKKVE